MHHVWFVDSNAKTINSQLKQHCHWSNRNFVIIIVREKKSWVSQTLKTGKKEMKCTMRSGGILKSCYAYIFNKIENYSTIWPIKTRTPTAHAREGILSARSLLFTTCHIVNVTRIKQKKTREKKMTLILANVQSFVAVTVAAVTATATTAAAAAAAHNGNNNKKKSDSDGRPLKSNQKTKEICVTKTKYA